MSTKQPFHARGFTSFIIVLSFLIMILSGAMLYVSPKGRVANWTGATMLRLEKEEWGGVHTTMAVVFIIAGGFHLYFNWGFFWRYLKDAAAKGARSKRELGFAAVLVAIVFAGTQMGVPPFSSIIQVSDNLKDYWERQSTPGPYPHAEESSLSELAENTGMDPDRLVERLKQHGYDVTDMSIRVRELAEQHGKTPGDLYADMGQGKQGKGTQEGGHGMGLGRMTVEAVCAQEGIALDAALARLKAEGIEAKAGDTLKAIAQKAGVTPRDVMRMLGE